MKLTGQDNKSFELWVIDYQFGDNTTDEYDSNWLTIGIMLKGFKKEWATSDPSLLTWEVKFLADWLQNLLVSENEESEIEFIEPNLKFELVEKVGDSYKIRTYLTLESKPNWFTDDETFTFDTVVDRGQIVESVDRLNFLLSRFWGRAGVNLKQAMQSEPLTTGLCQPGVM